MYTFMLTVSQKILSQISSKSTKHHPLNILLSLPNRYEYILRLQEDEKVYFRRGVAAMRCWRNTRGETE